MMNYAQKLSKIKKTSKKRRFEDKDIENVIFHIHLTRNNITITVTDILGDALFWATSGSIGFKNNRKSTPYAAKNVGIDASVKAAKLGCKSCEIKVQGLILNLMDETIRGISQNIRVDKITEVTPIAFNGVRPRSRRRV